MPYRVLIVSTSYPLNAESSSGIFVQRLVKNLPDHVEAKVLVPDGKQNVPPLNEMQSLIRFRYAPKSWQIIAHQPGGIPVALAQHKILYFLLPFFLLSMLLYCISNARKVHLIHANWAICGLIAGISGRLLGKPVITTLRGEDITRARTNWLDKQILNFCILSNQRIIAVSQSIVDWLVSVYPTQNGKFHLVENGVSEDFINNGRKRIMKESGSLHLLTVGSLIPRKQVATIIEAVGLLKNAFDFRLDIIGGGQESDTLRMLCKSKQLDNQVYFHGQLNPVNLPQVFASADIFLLASQSEGRPNVVLEAMASGLPVIASDIEGVNELVSKSNGCLFPVGDSKSLAQHISRLATDRNLIHRLGQSGHQFILQRGLDWKQTGQKYLKHYEAIAGDKCAA